MRNRMVRSWLGVVVLCGVTGVVYGAAGLRVSSNGRYIETTAGTPFLYLQDTNWLLNRHLNDQITALLDDRKTKGFTVIKIGMQGLNSGYQDYSSPTTDYDGNYPFDNSSVAQLNAGWWSRLVWIADQCAARCLYLELTIGGPGRQETGKPYCHNNAECYEYGRQVGQKFQAKTNIIFNIGQDMRATGGVGPDGWRAIAKGVADGVNGVNHPGGTTDYSTTFMLFHPDGHSPYSSSASFPADSWLDAHSIEVYHDNSRIYDAVTADYRRTNPVKPVVMLEGSYETDNMDVAPISPHYLRVEAWHSYFAGGFYGYGHFHNYSQASVNYSQTCNVNYVSSDGSKQMGYLASFMNAREWWKFVPDQGMISAGVGSGATRLAAVKSTDADECYIYFPTISTASIVMNRITTSTTVTATWFDPRNQRTQPAGTFASSATQSLTPPAGWEDAVLCLDAALATTVAMPPGRRLGHANGARRQSVAAVQ